MGLDQFARRINRQPSRAVDFQAEIRDRDTGEFHAGLYQEEIHYWRKHPNLQGWMQALYSSKGGTDSDFNCAPVLLTSEDIDRLESDLKAGEIPETGGFFFGKSFPEDVEDDLVFVAKARDAIAQGDFVYYSSWW